MADTPFKEFIKKYLSADQWDNLAELLNSNNIAVGKILKRPETATHEMVLKISKIIEVHPHTLITMHNLGANNLSEAERQHHHENYKLETQLESS